MTKRLVKRTKTIYCAMAHDGREAKELGKISASNIKAALRQAKNKWGQEAEYVTSMSGLEFCR